LNQYYLQYYLQKYLQNILFGIKITSMFVLGNTNRSIFNETLIIKVNYKFSITTKAKTPGYDPEVLETYVRTAVRHFRQQHQ